MRAMLWRSSLLLLVTLGGCTHALEVIDCDPTQRHDCSSISPEGVEKLADIITEKEYLQRQLDACEGRTHFKTGVK